LSSDGHRTSSRTHEGLFPTSHIIYAFPLKRSWKTSESHYTADGFCTYRLVTHQGSPHVRVPRYPRIQGEFLFPASREEEGGGGVDTAYQRDRRACRMLFAACDWLRIKGLTFPGDFGFFERDHASDYLLEFHPEYPIIQVRRQVQTLRGNLECIWWSRHSNLIRVRIHSFLFSPNSPVLPPTPCASSQVRGHTGGRKNFKAA
jgi:hypothetical protein